MAPPDTILKRSVASLHEVVAEISPATATMASQAIVAVAVLFESLIFIWLGATVRESDFLALESNSVPGGTSPSSILIILLQQLASAQEELPRWRHRASAGARHKAAPMGGGAVQLGELTGSSAGALCVPSISGPHEGREVGRERRVEMCMAASQLERLSGRDVGL